MSFRSLASPFFSVLPDRRAAAAALAVALLPAPAWAHSPIPGIEGFYVGLVHPLTTPAQIFALLALGVFFGQRRENVAWRAVVAFACAVLAGIALGVSGTPNGLAEPVLLVLALFVGVTAALWPASPVSLGVAAAGASGFLIGLASIPDPGPMRATIVTLSGSFVGASVLLLYCIGGLFWLREKATWSWVPIGFRVAAAWISAIAALLLALQFADTGQIGSA